MPLYGEGRLILILALLLVVTCVQLCPLLTTPDYLVKTRSVEMVGANLSGGTSVAVFRDSWQASPEKERGGSGTADDWPRMRTALATSKGYSGLLRRSHS
ncbi:unnamed protein product [Ectocarpus sp. 4 AP-2014]